MIKIFIFKIRKFIFCLLKKEGKIIELYHQKGSEDYKNVSMVMKATMSKVIKENLRYQLKKINIPTLIIWGKCDKTTPYKDALILNRHIKNAGLVTIEDAGHFVYLEQTRYFNEVVKAFILNMEHKDGQ